MPRYVDVEKLCEGRVSNDPVVIAAECEPTADVAPVVHAKWEIIQRTAHYVDGIGVDLETGKPCFNKKEYTYDEYRCPVCRKFAKGDYLRFCDYCGARFDEMFEEETDDTEIC